MKILKHIWHFLLQYKVAVLCVLIVAAGFYWFQWRPSEIKKECSYTPRIVAAVPELYQAQIDAERAAYDSCVKAHPSKPLTTDGDSLWGGIMVTDTACKNLPTGYGETAHPASPAKTVYDPANTATYNFCLHAHGL